MTGTLYPRSESARRRPAGTCCPRGRSTIARSLAHWLVENAETRARVPEIDRRRALRSRELAIARARRDDPAADASARCSRPRARATMSGCCPTPAARRRGSGRARSSPPRTAAALRVVPLVGPSAVLLALMASGMNGQRFAFHGYLPVKPDARSGSAAHARSSARAPQRARELFIETPYRNAAMLARTCRHAASRRRACAWPPT